MTNNRAVSAVRHRHSATEVTPGRILLEDYLFTRKLAMTERNSDPSALGAIQSSTKTWIEASFDPQQVDYSDFSIMAVQDKMLGLADFLMAHHANEVCRSEIRATELFIRGRHVQGVSLPIRWPHPR